MNTNDREALIARLTVLLKLTEAPAIVVSIDPHHESFRELLRETIAALRSAAPGVGGLVDARLPLSWVTPAVETAAAALYATDRTCGEPRWDALDWSQQIRYHQRAKVVVDALAPTRRAGGEAVAWGRWAEGLPMGTRLMEYDGVPLVSRARTDYCNVPLYTHPAPSAESAGVALIAAERRRQVEAEGWSAEHDDQWRHSEMARAAACYALQAFGGNHLVGSQRAIWPWADMWWKPSDDRLRNLAKAGALIAAEIDRINRLTTEGAARG